MFERHHRLSFSLIRQTNVHIHSNDLQINKISSKCHIIIAFHEPI